MKTFSFLLVTFIAVTTTISGLLMISNPDGSLLNIPLRLLDNTPFNNFFYPGILLVLVVGGINLTAIYTTIARSSSSYSWSIAGAIVTIGWIIVQMILIKSLHWLHFFYLAAGALIILIAYQLKGKWAA